MLFQPDPDEMISDEEDSRMLKIAASPIVAERQNSHDQSGTKGALNVCGYEA